MFRSAILHFVFASLYLTSGFALAASVDSSTLNGKMIMGYQGWFGCPGDHGAQGWRHWKAGESLTIDMLPDVKELARAERCDGGLKAADGSAVTVFSAQNPATVDRHFAWMKDYGIDGVALQRFATELTSPELKAADDTVLANVRASAQQHERVFFVEYDLSSMPVGDLHLVVDDWRRLVTQGLTKSRSYLHHRSHPVLGLWGIGFAGRDLSPAATDALLEQLRDASKPVGGLTLVGGVPLGWRTGERDAAPDPAWAKVWPQLDVISPWTVGRYFNESGADSYRTRVMGPDMEFARSIGVDYMPVLFPGFSWSNLMHARHSSVPSIFNQIPRRCGRFYWRQAANAINAGAHMLFTAMFDEVDEGTAMFKVISDANQVPQSPAFVTLDVDGCELPSDWYLRLGGAVQSALTSGNASRDLPLPLPAK